MRTHLKLRICLVLGCLVVFSLISFRTAGTPADTAVAIVVNSANPVSNLTLSELRKIYFGDRQYSCSCARAERTSGKSFFGSSSR
jgi:ABC-type phosphate transport system substrate-binding protein